MPKYVTMPVDGDSPKGTTGRVENSRYVMVPVDPKPAAAEPTPPAPPKSAFWDGVSRVGQAAKDVFSLVTNPPARPTDAAAPLDQNDKAMLGPQVTPNDAGQAYTNPLQSGLSGSLSQINKDQAAQDKQLGMDYDPTERFDQRRREGRPFDSEDWSFQVQSDLRKRIEETRGAGKPITKALGLEERRQQRIKSGAPRDFADALTEWANNPTQSIPYAAGAMDAAHLVDVYRASQQIESGKATDDDYNLVRDYAKESQRDNTLPATVVDILAQLPSFAGEMATSFGSFTAGKEAAVKTMQTAADKVIAREIKNRFLLGSGAAAKEVLGTMAGGVAQGLSMPTRIAQSTAQRMVPTYSVGEGTEKDKREFSLAMAKPGDDFATAVAKGFGDTAIEAWSEHTGHYWNDFAKWAGNTKIGSSVTRGMAAMVPERAKAIKAGIAAWWMSKAPNRTIQDFLEATRKGTAWDGVIGEMMEERLGELAKAGTGVDSLPDYYKDPAKFLEQLTAEGIAFSIPSAGATGLSAAGRMAAQKADAAYRERKKRAQDKQDIIPPAARATAVVPTGPAQESPIIDVIPADRGMPDDKPGSGVPPTQPAPAEKTPKPVKATPATAAAPAVEPGKVVNPNEEKDQEQGGQGRQGLLTPAKDTPGPVQGVEGTVSTPETPAARSERPATPAPREFLVDTEDDGIISARVIRRPDTVLVVSDNGLFEYKPEFAGSKSDEEIIQYSLEPSGVKGISVKDSTPATVDAPAAQPSIADVMHEAAKGLGITYHGEQERPGNQPPLHLFTEPDTKSTFGVENLDDLPRTLQSLKDKAAEAAKAKEKSSETLDEWVRRVFPDGRQDQEVFDKIAQSPEDSARFAGENQFKLEEAFKRVWPEASKTSEAKPESPLDKFEKDGFKPWQTTRGEWVQIMRGHMKSLGQQEGNGNRAAPDSDYEEYHKSQVAEAIKEGKTVPARVLQDYPELDPRPKPERNIPKDFESFQKEYLAAFERMKKYPVGSTGQREASARMAELDDHNSEWVTRIEEGMGAPKAEEKPAPEPEQPRPRDVIPIEDDRAPKQGSPEFNARVILANVEDNAKEYTEAEVRAAWEMLTTKDWPGSIENVRRTIREEKRAKSDKGKIIPTKDTSGRIVYVAVPVGTPPQQPEEPKQEAIDVKATPVEEAKNENLPVGQQGMVGGPGSPGNLLPEGTGGDAENRPEGAGKDADASVGELPADQGGNAAAEPGSGPKRATGKAGGSKKGHSGKPEGDASKDDASGTDASAGVPGAIRVERTEKKKSDNYHIPDNLEIIPGGPIARLKANIAAWKIVHRLREESRPATEEEKAQLARFTGWGSFKDLFNDYYGEKYVQGRSGYGQSHWDDKWGEYYRQLRPLMTDEEFQKAGVSGLTAFYTSREVVESMWKMVRRLGFSGGVVLEPSSGVGNFIGLMPKDFEAKSQIIMNEYDPGTAEVARYIYGGADVFTGKFEKLELPNNSVDLLITNVPFDSKKVEDETGRKYPVPLNLHNFFAAKGFDLLKPGGIMIYITSDSTMRANPEQRKYLADRGILLGAISLPETAFKENAGTMVSTDIIILRKPTDQSEIGEKWTYLRDLPINDVGGVVPVNEYYAKNPDMILGIPTMQGSKYRGGGEEYATKPKLQEDGTPVPLTELLDEAIERLPVDKFGSDPSKGIDVSQMREAEGQRDGLLTIKDGLPVMVVGDRFVSPTEIEPKATSDQVPRMVAFIGLRDIYEAQLSLEGRGASDEEIEANRKKLNEAYDAYVKKFNQLNSTASRFLKFDQYTYYTVTSLEDETVTPGKKNKNGKRGPSTKTYSKSAVFKRRVTRPVEAPNSATNLQDAFKASLGYYGKTNIPYIAKILSIGEPEAEKMLLENELVFRDPASGLLVHRELYLSGNVVQKLADARAAAVKDDTYKRNVDVLEKNQPEKRTVNNFTPAIGFAYTDTDLAKDILNRFFGVDTWKKHQTVIEYSEGTTKWSIKGPSTIAAKENYGVEQMSGWELFEHAVNGKVPVINGPARDPITNRPIYNEEASKLAASKINENREAFAEFMRRPENTDLAERMEARYNSLMNNNAWPTFDGSHLELPGMNTDVSLRYFQKDGIWRFIQTGRGLAFWSVGAGKTYAQIITGWEMKRLGLCHKPCHVMPSHLIEGFVQSFKHAYPQARIIVMPKGLTVPQRLAVQARVASSDIDAVIMSNDNFTMFRNDPIYEEEYVNEQIAKVQAKKKKEKEKSQGARALQRQIDKLMDTLGEVRERIKHRSPNTIYFQNSGIDFVLIDEAHNFKNTFVVTSHNQLRGVNTSFSLRGIDTVMKARYLQGRANGRGVILLTATPISNTIGEMYTLTDIIAPDLLEQNGMEQFDMFVQNFGSIEEVTAVGADGRLSTKPTLARYKNIHDLQNILSQVWDSITFETVSSYLRAEKERREAAGEVVPPGSVIPSIATGSTINVKVPRSNQTAKFRDQVILRALQIFTKLNGKDKREWSALPVVAYGIAQAMAVDYQLIDPKAKPDPNNKLMAAANNVIKHYKESESIKGTQLIMLDRYNPCKKDYLELFLDNFDPDWRDRLGWYPKPERASDVNTKELSQDDLDKILNGDGGLEAAEEMENDEDNPDAEDAATKKKAPKKKENNTYFLYEKLKRVLIQGGIPANEIVILHQVDKDDWLGVMDRVNEGEIRVVIGSTGKGGTGVNIQRRGYALHNIDTPPAPFGIEQRRGRFFRFGNINDEVYEYTYGTARTLDAKIFGSMQLKALAAAAAMDRSIANDGDDPVSGLASSAAEMMAWLSDDPYTTRMFELEARLKLLQSKAKAHEASRSRQLYELYRIEKGMDARQQRVLQLEALQKTVSVDWGKPLEDARIGKEVIETEDALQKKIDWLIERLRQTAQDGKDREGIKISRWKASHYATGKGIKKGVRRYATLDPLTLHVAPGFSVLVRLEVPHILDMSGMSDDEWNHLTHEGVDAAIEKHKAKPMDDITEESKPSGRVELKAPSDDISIWRNFSMGQTFITGLKSFPKMVADHTRDLSRSIEMDSNTAATIRDSANKEFREQAALEQAEKEYEGLEKELAARKQFFADIELATGRAATDFRPAEFSFHTKRDGSMSIATILHKSSKVSYETAPHLSADEAEEEVRRIMSDVEAAAQVEEDDDQPDPDPEKTIRNEADEDGEAKELHGGFGALFPFRQRIPLASLPVARADAKPHPLASSDPKVEANMQAAHGIKGRSIRNRVASRFQSIWNAATRAQIDIPNTPEFAAANELFRLNKSMQHAIAERVALNVGALIDKLTMTEYQIFERYLMLANLYESRFNFNQSLRYEMDDETLIRDYDAARQAVADNPKIEKAVLMRKALIRDITSELVELKLLPAGSIREEYFHHQINEFMLLHENRNSVGVRNPRVMPANFQRKRSQNNLNDDRALDPNGNYVQAETAFMHDAYGNISKTKWLNRLNSIYGRLGELRAMAGEQNYHMAIARFSGSDDVLEGRRLAREIEDLRLLMEIEDDPEIRRAHMERLNHIDPFYSHRKRMAIALSNLRSLGISLPDPDNPWDIDDSSLPSILEDVLEGGGEASIWAAMWFKAVANKRELLKNLVGDDFVTGEDLIKTLTPLKGSEGYVLWYPDTRNVFYPVMGIRDKAMGALAAEIQKSLSEGLSPNDKELFEKLATQVMVMGKKRPGYVLPVEIVRQLERQTLPNDNTLAWIMRGVNDWTKKALLFAPWRVGPFTVRNIISDAEVALSFRPQAMKFIPRAYDEAFRAFRGEYKRTQDWEEAMELGVLDTGLVASDVPDIMNKTPFRRFRSQGKIAKFGTKVGDTLQTYRDWSIFRENVLRYAVYLSYVEDIKRENPITDYGASIPVIVKGVRKHLGKKEAAARMSREIMNDYQDMTHMGQFLRSFAFPFWGWREKNALRYYRRVRFSAQSAKAKADADAAARRIVGNGGPRRKVAMALVWMLRLLMLGGLYLPLWLWNNVYNREAEAQLPASDRHVPHVILGRNKDGSIRVFRNVSALGDLLDFFGGSHGVELAKQYDAGQITLQQVVSEFFRQGLLSNMFNSTAPAIKGAAEVTAGVSFFPDATRPRKVSRMEALANATGTRMLYKAGAGLASDTPGPAHGIQQFGWGVVDPGPTAFYEIKDLVQSYRESLGKPEPPSFPPNDYTARMRAAAAAQDRWTFEEVRKQYDAMHGEKSGTDFKRFLSSSFGPNALYQGLTPDERDSFLATLTDEQKVKAQSAEQYRAFMQDELGYLYGVQGFDEEPQVPIYQAP